MGETIFSGAFFRLLSVDPFAGRPEIDDVSHTLILTLSGYAFAVATPFANCDRTMANRKQITPYTQCLHEPVWQDTVS